MIFKRIDPLPELEKIIECYWIAVDDSTAIKREKIIPDGFTEIIFHFGDAYRICWMMPGKSNPKVCWPGR